MAWFRRQQFTLLNNPDTPNRIPDGLCSKCTHCGTIHLTRDFVHALRVCNKCGHHEKVPLAERINQLVDIGSFKETHPHLTSGDPLGFTDSKKYPDRIAQSQQKTGTKDAVVTGMGKIYGMDASFAFMNFAFIGGSMGSVVGEKVTRCMEDAIAKKVPAVVVCASGGARMQEGILSLMQMAKTSALVGKMHQAGLPYIPILTDPTTAGVMASYASLGDIIIAEPQALVGFAGPRVIEQTIRQVLPKGFQRSEFVQDHGFIDCIVHRQELKEQLATALAILTRQKLEMAEEE